MTFLRKVAKVGGAGLVVATTGGAGAATAVALMNKVNGTTYTVDRWGPLKEDATLVGLHYGPSVSLDTTDKVTISGTPFDGVYDVKKGRTRNDVWIKPNAPVTTSGTSGTMRVKTSVQARLRHLGDAAVATTRTGAKKTGKVVKGAGNYLWNKIKKGLLILLVILILFFIVKTYLGAKVAKVA